MALPLAVRRLALMVRLVRTTTLKCFPTVVMRRLNTHQRMV